MRPVRQAGDPGRDWGQGVAEDNRTSGTGCVRAPNLPKGVTTCYFDDPSYPLTTAERRSFCTDSGKSNAVAILKHSIRNKAYKVPVLGPSFKLNNRMCAFVEVAASAAPSRPLGSPLADIPQCFSAMATVELQGGFVKLMSDVQIGDGVKVADGVFSDVFMLSHRLADSTNNIVVVKTVAGTLPSLSVGH